jgi:citronellol/citronellal dehydrogenase
VANGRLAGKTALVTGASRGIGRSIALGLAREGARVGVAAKTTRSRPRLPGSVHSVVEEIQATGGQALALPVNVRDVEAVEGAVQTLVEQFGGLDLLVNNAGALWWQPVAETPMKRFDLVMEVNVRAAFAASRAAIGPMRRAGGGHIVMMSPPLEPAALPGRVAYLISKFGMTLLAMGLAEELRGDRIGVNALWPATAVESQATINYGIGSPKVWRKPEILADAVLEIAGTAPAELTGRALIDEDFLRERGWTDFSRYRCDPDHEPPRLTVGDLPARGPVR